MLDRTTPLFNKRFSKSVGHADGIWMRTRLTTPGPPQARPARLSRGVLAFLLALLAASLPADYAWSSTDRESKVVAIAIDAIKRNNSLVQSAQLTLRETREDAEVEKPEVQTHQRAGGERLTIMRFPKVQWDTQVHLQDNNLRVDRTALGNHASVAPTETLAFTKGLWTQYFPEGSTAWIRRHHEMPKIFPVDPREAASEGAHRGVLDVLQEDKIVSADLAKSTDGSPLIQIVTSTAAGNQTTYEFAGRDSFLPSRVETRWPDGSLLQLVQVQYQDVLNGRAKFLKKCTRLFFPKGFTLAARQTGWRQRLTTEVIGEVLFNQAIDEDIFAVRFAPGTRISDNTRLANYYATSPIAVTRHPLWPYTAAIVVCLLVLTVVRRLYSLKKT